jgi:hypothetical protein
VGGGCVAGCSSHLVANACKNTGFVFDSTGGECNATQVPPLICYIIMPHMDKAANFARECAFDRHLSPTAIAGCGHIQRGVVVPEADVVPLFVH